MFSGADRRPLSSMNFTCLCWERTFPQCNQREILAWFLDPNLRFDNHITTSVSECIARLAQINRVKHCLDKNTLLTVIHALVFSKMYYCWNVWANTTNKNVRKLQAVQNFACRIVSGAKKYDHVTPLLKSLSWLPVKDHRTIAKLLWPFCVLSH